jgi:hypothetical protein
VRNRDELAAAAAGDDPKIIYVRTASRVYRPVT